MAGQGLTIARYIQAKGGLGPLQAAKVGLQVVDHICATEDYSLVHPGRIWIGEDRKIRVEDSAPSKRSLISQYPDYVAPELVQGKSETLKTCLYSFGCTLFELTTGQPPFLAAEAQEVLRAHLKSPVPDVADLASQTPPRLSRLIAVLLAKDPAKRPSQFETLRKLLHQIIASDARSHVSTTPKTRAGTSDPRRASNAPKTAKATAAAAPRVASTPVAPAAEPQGASGGARSRPRTGVARRRVSAGRKTASSKTFTLLGLMIGIVVGLFLGFRSLEAHKKSSEEGGEKAQLSIGREQKRRTSAVANEEKERRVAVNRLLGEVGKKVDPALRVKLIAQRMNDAKYAAAENAHLLAEAFSQAWLEQEEPPGRVTKTENRGSEAYTRIRTDAFDLLRDDKWGDALNRMGEAYELIDPYPTEEVDRFIEKLSERLTERWSRDEQEILELLARSERKRVLERLQEVKVYGDDCMITRAG